MNQHIIHGPPIEVTATETLFLLQEPEAEHNLSRFLVHITLGAIAAHELQAVDVGNLLETLAEGDDKPLIQLAGDNVTIVKQLITESKTYLEIRSEAVTEHAAKGSDTTTLMADLRSIYRCGDMLGRLGYMDAGGWELEMSDSGTTEGQPIQYEIDDSSAADADIPLSLIADLNATHLQYRRPLIWHNGVPAVLHNGQYMVIGAVDGQGMFDPLATILNENHPAHSSYQATDISPIRS